MVGGGVGVAFRCCRTSGRAYALSMDTPTKEEWAEIQRLAEIAVPDWATTPGWADGKGYINDPVAHFSGEAAEAAVRVLRMLRGELK